VEERKEKKGEVSLIKMSCDCLGAFLRFIIKKVKYLNRIGNKIFEGIV
jgi:hypothetical protein